MSRYGKRVDLVVHEDEPFNAETGLAGLVEGPLTATDAFYVRGHGAVPEIDPAAWRLRVQGAVERELDLSLATLREALREREVTATLQCAGNRRAGLVAIRDIPGEAPWGPGGPPPPPPPPGAPAPPPVRGHPPSWPGRHPRHPRRGAVGSRRHRHRDLDRCRPRRRAGACRPTRRA